MRAKRWILIAVASCLAVLFFGFPVNAERKADAPEDKVQQPRCPYAQSMQHGQAGQQGQAGAAADEGWRCPMGGASRGPGACPGMMDRNPGYHGGGYMAPSRQRGGTEHYKRPLSKDQAEMIMENYLRETNNPNLKVGELTEEEDYYVAPLETKDGSLVDKIQIHKMTGWIRSEYNVPEEEMPEKAK